MVITVTNALQEEPVVIHWHGLHIVSKYPPTCQLLASRFDYSYM
jgi:FtsP/CotA-like multicopper oxidase with cupredoxin domain